VRIHGTVKPVFLSDMFLLNKMFLRRLNDEKNENAKDESE